jgi:hypothetical protein
MTYTKKKFQEEWAKEDCEITFGDIADCAKAWGICGNPRCCPILTVRYEVVKAAGCPDAEDYNPVNLND